MRKISKAIVSVLAVIFVGVLSWNVYFNQRAQVLKDVSVRQEQTATIFVPGLHGRYSFTGMIHRLNHYDIAQHALTVNVSKKGKIKVHKLAPLKDNPTIKILFSADAEPKKEAKQLVAVMQTLKRDYHIQKINLVGHSSGGNIIFDYLTATNGRPDLPTPKKFVSIATTYPNRKQQAKQLPANLRILNIAGEIDHYHSDGAVSVTDDLAMGKLVEPYVASYQARTIHGNILHTFHSMLHENPDVDRLIANYLYQ
ncbi:hypothetical protein BSQ39_00900 [Loigolactobacillus backii]|uniref:alpha/beta hydrolase n=1 Tax=Loigolactobacillus backii TaxID=375175 RepID=UPI000C1CC028|nr:alpha/beta hydrolase [Loigolactobacillus backii]PIO82217.1 hypothetical protein BSQ39_00900 [Loigolactobacillus backii]